IVAIGNAPTALRETIRLVKEGKTSPALIVGIPVGFVGAAESKSELERLPTPYITNRGTKGGSAVAAAIVNALLRMA
ncbi:MAG: precorrin-8X methylmutase, partial [Candidatus Brocadiales bacterium]